MVLTLLRQNPIKLLRGSDHVHDFVKSRNRLRCRFCDLTIKFYKEWWAKYKDVPFAHRPHCVCCRLPALSFAITCKDCENRRGVPKYEKGTEEIKISV